MPDSNQTKNRDAITQILADVEKEASEVEQMGQEMVRSARFTRDVLKPTRDFFSQIPNDDMLSEEEWQRAKEGWNAVKDSTQNLVKHKGDISHFTVTVSGSTASTISSIITVGPVMRSFEPVRTAARADLTKVLERVPLVGDVQKSITRLGLDVRTARRSALQLLEDSKLALDGPQTPEADAAAAVLIPLRECLESILAELVRRRPKQEETGSKTASKIISIGNQCGRPNFQADHFDRLGVEYANFTNRLSGTKQANMPRNEIMTQFNQGLLLLKTFLDSIDESKLRAP